ncbi:hypothetical protein BVX93_00635, partial [bacterium B13(2017)]
MWTKKTDNYLNKYKTGVQFVSLNDEQEIYLTKIISLYIQPDSKSKSLNDKRLKVLSELTKDKNSFFKLINNISLGIITIVKCTRLFLKQKRTKKNLERLKIDVKNQLSLLGKEYFDKALPSKYKTTKISEHLK